MHTVLLVEDEELISTMVRLNLEQEGFAVQHFGNAESMLEFATSNPSGFDIVLLDIMLPGMTGEEALPKLRKHCPDVPVMMLTAKQDVETRVSTLNRGADDYLPKPFNVLELIARVNSLLRRHGHSGADKEGS
jgi:DNA-binding response OmpR family regulator